MTSRYHPTPDVATAMRSTWTPTEKQFQALVTDLAASPEYVRGYNAGWFEGREARAASASVPPPLDAGFVSRQWGGMVDRLESLWDRLGSEENQDIYFALDEAQRHQREYEIAAETPEQGRRLDWVEITEEHEHPAAETPEQPASGEAGEPEGQA